jgi:hypothetical protein
MTMPEKVTVFIYVSSSATMDYANIFQIVGIPPPREWND